jgi:hypothetical protein
MSQEFDGPDGLSLLPEHMRGPVDRYINHGIPPGGFLEAVICNDLAGAVARADHINRHRLVDIVRYMMWFAPANCWGGVPQYAEWCLQGGLNGLGTQQERGETKSDQS